MVLNRAAICTKHYNHLFGTLPQRTSKIFFSSSTKRISSECSTELVDNLLSRTSALLSSSQNLVAFSGGVDSSLVAALVYQSSQKKSHTNSAIAVMGVSNSLPVDQMEMARNVAQYVGIELQEIHTSEGDDPTYIQNQGQSCFVCKSHLYSSISAIARHANSLAESSSSSSSAENSNGVVLFNGTNKDDVSDPTRIGLLAAQAFQVRSPLVHITKTQVRQASRHLGLPNWNHAASPCLRSRLAFGVEATAHHLLNVSKAEQYIRTQLSLQPEVNFRARVLSKKRVRIELDADILNSSKCINILRSPAVKQYFISLGFTGGIVDIREFKSGSVAVKLSDSSSLLSEPIVQITKTKYADAA